MVKLYEGFHKNTSFQKSVIKENNFTYRHILFFVNKYLKGKNSVLDIGCGSGTLCFYIASKNIKILGVDISKKAITACNKSSKILKLDKLASFKVVNFPENSISGKYDLIILTEVIEHIQNDSQALESIYKLLNKNGILIITTPSLNAPLYKFGLATGFDKRVGHLRRYTIESLSKKCKKAGFKVVETKKIEGVLRNFLFLNQKAGKLVKLVKFFISDIVTILDNLLVISFGESNIVVVCKK